MVATNNTKNCLSSVYRIPSIHIGAKVCFTNASPIRPYRGAGRPKAFYIVERLIDRAAQVTGIDRVEIRRRNLVPSAAMPNRAPSGQTYDSGEFETVLDKAISLADWEVAQVAEFASVQFRIWSAIGHRGSNMPNVPKGTVSTVGTLVIDQRLGMVQLKC